MGNFVVIDLGATKAVGAVRVHQRNDGCCQDRLRDFTVTLLADSGGTPGAAMVSGSYPGQPPTNSFGEVTLSAVGSTDTATVTVAVAGVNDAPNANSATYTVQEDGPAITQAMAGSDVDTGDVLTFSTTSAPALGALSDNGNGTFTFDPNGDFESLALGERAVVTFNIRAQDLLGASASATITIIVQGSNDDPLPVADTGATDEDTLLVVAPNGVLSNDGDTDGNAVGVQSIDTTGTTGSATVDLMSLKLGAGLSGTIYDYNAGTPAGFTLNNNNNTANQAALLLPLPAPGEFVLQRMGLSPSATVITPRVDFGNGTQTTQGTGTVLDRGGYSSGGVPPWQGLFNDAGETADMDGDQIAGIWTGKLQITTGGNYTFTTRSDDGTVLFINGVRIVDNNRFQGMTNRSGSVNLAPGLHDITIGGYEGGGGAGMQASYTGSDTGNVRVIIPPAVLYNDVASRGTFVSGGLRGDYYDTNNPGANGGFNFNIDEFMFFRTTPEMDIAQQALYATPANTDMLSPRIDFGNDTRVIPGDGSNPERGAIQGNIYGGIGAALDQDQIGGVWTGSLWVPESADFRFWQRVDDGGTVLIDVDVDGNGSVHDASDFALGQGNADGTVTLSMGMHKIVVASREGGGNHRMVVSWQQLTGTNPFPREVIPPQNLLLPSTGMVGDGSYTYDPNGQFESLNVGDTATDTFTYTLVDPFGNTSTQTVTITINGVNDPPEVTALGVRDIVIYTSSPAATVGLFPHFEDVDNADTELSYAVTGNTNPALIGTSVVDSADGNLDLTTPCTLVGTSDITVTVEDPGGHTVSDTFKVTVVDDVAPECPPLLKYVVTAPAGQTSAVVNYPPVVMIDKVDGSIVATCSPPSGSTFPWGATVVTCTASDAAGNSTTCEFLVAVKLPGDIVLGGPQAGASVAGASAADSAPGVGAKFETILGAHLTLDGRLLVEADAGGGVGLWAGELASMELVAHAPTTTPTGAAGSVAAFDRYAIAVGGDVGYGARLSNAAPPRTRFCNWTWGSGATTNAGVLGSSAPGTAAGTTFAKFPAGAWAFTDEGEHYFLANLTGGGSDEFNNQGVFSESGGLLLRENDPVTSIPGALHAKFGTQLGANASGELVFSSNLRGGAVLSGGDNIGVFSGLPGSLELVARRGDLAPGLAGGAEIDRVFDEAINGQGEVVFTAYLRGGTVSAADNTALLTDAGGTLRAFAREGDAAPGLPGAAFDSFSDAEINNKGEVLFRALLVASGGGAALTASEDEGIFGYVPGSGVQLVVAEGATPPGTAGSLVSLPNLSVHEGGDFAFDGRLRRGVGGVTRNNDHAVWTVSALGAAPQVLVRGGDVFADADGDGDDEVVRRVFISGSESGGTSGRSGAIACGNIAVVVSYDQGRQTVVWVLGVPD